MHSRVRSALSELDGNLRAIQLEIERLRAGSNVSNDQLLRGSLVDACGQAALIRDLIYAERPDADWSDRESLELLLNELDIEAQEKLKQQRREKLLALAEELEAGSVRHRFENRSVALNTLRLEAVGQLRARAAEPEQEKDKELPGPEATQWLHWACNLDDKHDASAVAQLCRDFEALDRFVTETEEAYWVPANRSQPQATAPAESALAATGSLDEASRPDEERSPSLSGVPPLHAIIAISSTAATGAQLSPVPQSVAATAIQGAELSHQTQASEEPPSESGAPTPKFGEIAAAERHVAPWLVVAAVIVLIALFAAIYHFHSRNNTAANVVAAESTPPPAASEASQSRPAATSPVSPGLTAGAQQPKSAAPNTTDNKGSLPTTADPKSAVSLLHKQPAEGTQDNIGLSVESCARVNSQNIECWGYLSNLRGNDSKISLYRVNAVDGKGNTFDLTSGAQPGFSSHNFKVPAQSRVKYSVKVPDTDPGARTLTLYLDVNNPRNVEYTFRDIPIAE